MTGFNLTIKLLTILLLVTAIAIFAERSRACSACDPHGVMISQNNESMDNGQGQSGETRYAISPVSHVKVQLTKATPFTIYRDMKFYFASDQEKEQFLQDPQKYINSANTPSGQENKQTQPSGNKGMYQ